MNRVAGFAVLSTALFAAGCHTAIDYSAVSTPEEGGVKFIKITEEEDGVVAPTISDNGRGRMTWEISHQLDVSKDGARVAYVGYKAGKWNVFVKSTDGGRAALQRTFRDAVGDVSLSPDGQWLAFRDFRESNFNIYTVGAESGSAIRQITTSSLNDTQPEFSPDSSQIVFVQSEVQVVAGGRRSFWTGRTSQPVVISRPYIWTYGMEKGVLTQYGEGTSPAFFPDGKRIAVVRTNKATGGAELWIMDLSNGQEIIVASAKDRGFGNPCVSPDGRTIALVSTSYNEVDGRSNLDIFTIGIDGGNLTQITFHPGNDTSPRWSPDGRSIYFFSQRGTLQGAFNVWRMDLK